ncbi:hypothetical protein G6F22_017676 [Rhizopus arrhizus]|nr:hypothetical protein G6F22_017676 [Rhizopus arrhizus]
MYLRPEISLSTRLAVGLMGLALAICVPATGLAQADNLLVAPEAPTAPPSHLVRELLEHDAKQALALEHLKSKTSLAGSPVAAASAPADTGLGGSAAASQPQHIPARLVAILGVGNRLAAHVQLGGRQAIYLSGTAAPISGPSNDLRLLEIATPCATFLSRTEATLPYCLDEGTR